jgi:hypothetical protein
MRQWRALRNENGQNADNGDIRDLLAGLVAAIELDQLRVDALPPEKFNAWYSDSMWRRYRRDHIDYINRILASVNSIQSALLQELDWLAISYEPATVREVAVELLAEAASGSRPAEELATAALFFGSLIKDVTRRPAGTPVNCDAKVLVMQWLVVDDPLGIAEDPECGYGRPAGFVD